MASSKIGPGLLKARVAKRLSFDKGRGPLDLTLAVVSFNQWAISERFLRSFEYEQAPLHSELIWVDNASTDGSAERFKQVRWKSLGHFRKVTYLSLKKNYFISGAVNVALAQAQGRYFIQADNDVLFAPGSLTAYLHALQHRPGAYLSPLWQRTQNLLPFSFEPACYEDLPTAWERLRGVNSWLQPEEGVAAGSCWGADTATLKKLGGWSEAFRLQGMDDDAILRWRQNGGSAGMLPLPVFHPGLKTRRADHRASDWELEDMATFQKRWKGQSIDDLRQPKPWQNRVLAGPIGKLLQGLHFF
jgi:GT2 family glycosyltransferase